jgi:hypothetical protein
MDTAAAMYRLEQLRQVFLNITSPQHLTDTMAEGGCLLAHLIQQQWVPANGFFKDQAAAALVDPVPRWDTDSQMFRRWGLWQLYANEYSDSPRTVLHTQPAVGPGWIVRRSTQAADQTEPVVTETELPRTDVTQQTKWGQDYAQQGQRYALFVSELLAELVKQERTVTEQDVQTSCAAVEQVKPASNRRKQNSNPVSLANKLRQKIEQGYIYPGYSKLVTDIGGSNGTWTNIFNATDNTDLVEWRDNRGVCARNDQEAAKQVMHLDDEYLPDDEVEKLFQGYEKQLPKKDRQQAREAFDKLDPQKQRKMVQALSK